MLMWELQIILGHGGVQCADYLREHLHDTIASRVRDEIVIDHFETQGLDQAVLTKRRNASQESRNGSSSQTTSTENAEAKENSEVTKTHERRTFAAIWHQCFAPSYADADLVNH